MVKVVFTRPDFNVGQSPLEGSRMVWVDPKWPKLSGFYVVTTLETILGCILTDFSWTTPLDFLDIMLGLPERSQLCSVIFEVRTVIFGQNDLCPYAGRGFYFLWIPKTLTIEPSDGQSRFHPARLQCWSEPSGRLREGFG